ncbi:cytochrome P450 [Streptomyces sp. NPDC013178]|uniref:cytochrome P450 family protein n=1 Tax=Streptomyces sp. NPDC013178 TaxID=3155118 RepID=UPI0033E0BABF
MPAAMPAPDPEPLTLGRDIFDDPHRLAAALRRESAVRQVTTPRGITGWLVTRYDDCRAALNDPRLLKDSKAVTEVLGRQMDSGSPYLHASARLLESHMLNTDPPDHTRLRALVNKAFTPKTVARLRPRIEDITDDLLDAMAEAPADSDVDLVKALAQPLPIAVIGEMLGIDAADRHRLLEWTRVIVSSAPGAELVKASDDIVAYLDGLIERKRAEPADDLMSALVQVSDQGDRLSRDELIAMGVLMVIAGHDTTVNLIGNGVLALLSAPEQLRRLRADPSLLPGAVEELLRYDGPVHVATHRVAAEPLELGGTPIPQGGLVMISLLAANRDEERFPDPDQLDITRDPKGHLAFGHGIHYCLGALLARTEARIALERLLARFPALRLGEGAGELSWYPSLLIHGLVTLPVRLR